MYNKLLELISNLIEFQEEDLMILKESFKPLSVKKDTILISHGDIADRAFFINSGYLRYFKNTENGSELTIHLSSPGEFAASFCSFVQESKSEEILHSYTDCELLSITKPNLEKLYHFAPKWLDFGRKLMEQLLLEKEKRILNQISLNAQERYVKLLETNPGLINNTPIQYLASYIGIHPESLSRIRKQIFLTNVSQ